jgi:hypothetical protein
MSHEPILDTGQTKMMRVSQSYSYVQHAMRCVRAVRACAFGTYLGHLERMGGRTEGIWSTRKMENIIIQK